MNKKDIQLIAEAFNEVKMGPKPSERLAAIKKSIDLSPDEYEDSWLETDAANTASKLINQTKFNDAYFTDLPKELKEKVIETWIDALQTYYRQVRTESDLPERDYGV